LFEIVGWFRGLTCDFWAENEERKLTAKAKAMKSVASSSTTFKAKWWPLCGWDAALKPPLYLRSKGNGATVEKESL
jgi:hypothetical protein